LAVIAVVAVEGCDEGMFPYGLESGWTELEQEVAVEFLECTSLAIISLVWVRVMITGMMMMVGLGRWVEVS
jgi:hypothetical protein